MIQAERAVEPRGRSACLHAEVRFGTQAGHLTSTQAGRHPGQKLAHSSLARPWPYAAGVDWTIFVHPSEF